jgi:lipopolysaccharide transport system ATP-binding protein
MAIHFREATFAPLDQLTASAPDGALIAVIGEDGSGQRELLRLAAGLAQPAAGTVESPAAARYLGPTDALDLSPVAALALDHTLAPRDPLTRARAAGELERLRRSGTTVLFTSHEPELIAALADEVWWLHEGRLRARGDYRQVLPEYQRHLALGLRAAGDAVPTRLATSLRRGDGRAEIIALETLGASGQPTIMLQSGEVATIRVTVRFQAPVDQPVIGIMIRTRIGFEVYGTNTELENLALGPVAAGQTLRIAFEFPCLLCPQEYTLTAASHDPDGVWHDWMEDALAFSVADSRYTAGVANLRAQVTTEDH